MRPVIINLVSGTSFAKQMGLPLVVLLVLTSIGFTGFNFYSYIAAQHELKIYGSILTRAREKALTKHETIRKKIPDKEAVRQAQAYLKELEPIVTKTMFPAVQLLDALETAKPDSLVLDEVRLSQPAGSIVLKGETFSEESVSNFLFALVRSELFKIEITSESIDDSKKIRFEIEATLK
jgi:Tfp pilus assembly protein PilN